MTAAVYRTTQPSLIIPHTQNTAPVLEFNCLYTHDIRRKQKRWQDGFLRFHTFNKRVMVYDIPRNFIGDTHWKEDDTVQDGDEVTLEKDGVLVQVAESVGRTETDLTELRRSKNKGSSEHGSSPAKGAQTPAARRGTGTTQKQGSTQIKHRSLNALLGFPKGPLGKVALSSKSPYEERMADTENEEWEDGRPPKRQRVEQAGAWNVTRTTKTPTVPKNKEGPLWARTADAKQKKKKTSAPAGQQMLGTKEVIELSDDEQPEIERQGERFLPGFSSDVLAPPSSPAKELATSKASQAKVPPVRSNSPAFPKAKAAPRLENATARHLPNRGGAADQFVGANKKKAKAAAARRDPAECADRSAPENPRPERDLATDDRCDEEVESIDEVLSAQQQASKAGQTLRMTARSSKKTLLCQTQLTKKPSRTCSTNTETAIGNLLSATSEEDVPLNSEAKSQRELLEERLAKIRDKSTSVQPQAPQDAGEADIPRLDASKVRHCPENVQSRKRAHPEEDPATALAELDQRTMPPDDPPLPPAPLHAMAPPPKRDRHLRKVVSEVARSGTGILKKAPGAPMGFTPSPSKRGEGSTAPIKGADKPANVKTTLPPKSRSKKPLQRSVSLSTAANGTSAVIFSKPFQTPKAPASKAVAADKAPDPWSREAFDLFAWRPPGWDERQWCVS